MPIPAPDARTARWEAGYLAFETPEQEVRKFRTRLEALGARSWSREGRVLELCCGRGNGLEALAQLGFSRVEGIDLSPRLAAEHRGPGTVRVADCRALPYADASLDLVLVQGGLHHLLELPGDLERTVVEARRVLRPGARFVAVEPWRTPFLDGVHWLARRGLVRRLSRRVDAFQTMVENEIETYSAWLAVPEEVLACLRGAFEVERCRTGWGKLSFVGRAPEARR